VDRQGIFAMPTEKLLGLRCPPLTIDGHNPDLTYHEAGKYASLALKANPTVTELLWLPDDLYEIRTDLGDQLIAIREGFLSRKLVRSAYLGYASAQLRKLEAREDHPRTSKHARHLLRLLFQGLEIYETGKLTVKLANPEHFREFGEVVAAGDFEVARRELASAEHLFATIESPLPESPYEQFAEAWLQDVRREFY
jgi:predicted nucleotidyltransferase